MTLSMLLSACGGGGGGGGVSTSMSLSATALTPGEIQISWSADPTPGVIGYDLYRDGVALYGTHISGTNITDRGLQPDTRYCYKAYAVVFPLGVVGQSNTACANTSAYAAGWSISNVGTGDYADLALDASLGKHIVFRRADGLHYAVNTGTGWVDTLVDANAGSSGYTSIALDHAGKPHLAYRHEATGGVYHATNASGAWTIEAVNVSGGWVTALAVDSADKLRFAYSESPNYEVWYASNAAGAWSRSFLMGYGNNIQSVDIALDSTGIVHIAYAVGDGICGIEYANNAGGAWTVTGIDSSTACGAALALDSSDIPHVAYWKSMDVIHASLAGGIWNKEIVDTLSWIGGSLLSIDMDNGGHPHISYADQNGDLKYARKTSGGWTTVYIDQVTTRSILKIGADNRAYILYGGDGAGTLSLAVSP